MKGAEDIKSQILAATVAVVPATRGCVYSVGRDLCPYDHLTDSLDTSRLARYPQFSHLDPFHPRYFAHQVNSVFRTHEGRGHSGQQNAYVTGFRQPMGVAFKTEVFLRDRQGTIVGGVRLSRSPVLGEFRDDEVARLQSLQPVLSMAWKSALTEARVGTIWLQLTARENEVFACLRSGLSNKQICRELGMALPTAKSHVQKIMRKAGVSTRTELLANLI